jgi:glycosyltransferase involved in cell wall biosynthesis
MKVLLIAPQPFFTERGTPIAVRHLIETLCADGHSVDLLTYPFGEDVGIDGLTIHRCARVPGVRRVRIGFSLAKLLQDLPLFARLYRMSRRTRYDVVHAVEESVYGALLLRRVHRAHVIYDMDSSLAEQLVAKNVLFRLISPVLHMAERWAMRNADVVAPMCQDLARYARAVRDDDVPVLHDVPVRGGGPEGVSAPLERAPGHVLALYVGNLEFYQGIELLIEAVSLLPGHCPVQVAVVGGPMNEVRRLRKVATDRGLRTRLRFLGPKPVAQLEHLLTQADVLLSPRTLGANTPLKLYSYMASGRAILATRLRAHTQVLDDSTALLVEPEPEGFARGLLRLVGDPDLRRVLGTEAKRRVASQYSLSSFQHRVRSVYWRSRRERDRVAARSGPGYRELQPESDRRRRDRRYGGDRRSAARGAFDRRIGDRRALAMA